MNWKRFLVISVVVLSAGTIARLVRDNLFAQNSSDQADRVPFTATQTMVGTKDGQPVFRTEIQIARKRDGSVARKTTALQQNGTEEVDREIFNMSTRRFALVDNFTRSKSTGVLPTSVRAALDWQSDSSCSANLLPNASAENETMLGYQVVKTTETSQTPTGKVITIVNWMVPQLNCFPLKRKYVIVSENGTVSETVTQTSSIFQGEPDSRLFEVPANYTERSPATVAAERARMLNVNCFDCGSDYISRAEEKYWKNQPNVMPMDNPSPQK